MADRGGAGVSGIETAAWEAVWGGAVAVPVGRGGWIRVRGEDRVRWLNGMVTNSIGSLGPGEGCLNLLLSAQGRIQGIAWAFQMGEEILLQTDQAEAPRLLEMLDRFVIMDDVELTDVSERWEGLVVLGPSGGLELRAAGLEIPPGSGTSLRQAGEATVIHKAARLVPRWEVWGPKEGVARLNSRLLATGAAAGGPGILEQVRLLEGVPQFGVDIRERELPQETGLVEALHFNKGCYLGQEIVERIRSRGSVHRTFVGLELPGELPEPGVAVMAGEKPVGEVTSVGAVPGWPGLPDGARLALGFVRREALDGRTELRVGGEVARPLGLPVPIWAPAHPKEV